MAHDDDNLPDSLDVFCLGGRTVCSQCIMVNTSRGPVFLAGDDIYRYDLLASGILARLRTITELLRAST